MTPRTETLAFRLTFRDGAYYVSVPNLQSCMVVEASHAETLEREGIELERELADYKAHFEACDKQRLFATEALAQREEELAAERRKNRELSLAIGKARELLRDSATPFDTACTILNEIPPL